MPWPADVYLEGGDQYRGWFRSSLVTAVATKAARRTKASRRVGWVVDQDGRAMHKSAGNYIGAIDGMEKYGADVLRLWVASVECTADVRLGAKLLENVANVYRNLRNRFRWYSARSTISRPTRSCRARDGAARPARAGEARRGRARHRRRVSRVPFARRVSRAAAIRRRRSLGVLRRRAQGPALHERAGFGAPPQRAVGGARDLPHASRCCAPILSFTAEEAWQALPERAARRARERLRSRVPGIGPSTCRRSNSGMSCARCARRSRQTKASATFSSMAHVTVPRERYARYGALGDNLREALIVSDVELQRSPERDAGNHACKGRRRQMRALLEVSAARHRSRTSATLRELRRNRSRTRTNPFQPTRSKGRSRKWSLLPAPFSSFRSACWTSADCSRESAHTTGQ